MLIDHPWILPLLRALLESFFLVLLGGMFVLGEASLKTAKENTERSSRIYHLRPIFRFIAVFIFVFTAVMTTDTLETLFPPCKDGNIFLHLREFLFS